VRGSDAPPQTFQTTGFGDQTFDLVVRPKLDWATLVRVTAGAGLGYLALQKATYKTV
jgi:hypothetical protein